MNKTTIRHMVIFNLRHAQGSEKAAKFLRDGREILSSIPVVTEFNAFEQVSPKNDYNYGFSMDFASQQDYDTYNAHPMHTSFVEERWMKEVVRHLEIDFRSA